jgi:hypothetical protein
MKSIQRNQAVLSACRREISLHVRKPISKKVYRRSNVHHHLHELR